MIIGKKSDPLDINKLTDKERKFLRGQFIDICASALNQNFQEKAGAAFDDLIGKNLQDAERITVNFPVEIMVGVLTNSLHVYRKALK